MPKPAVSSAVKLSRLVAEFKNELIEDNSGCLFCSACGLVLTGMTKFLVKQHTETGKHKANGVLKNKHTTLTSPPKRKELPEELCEAFVSANISLKKLENPTFRTFLEKYMQRKLPNETTIRKNYLDNAKDGVIKKIRQEIADSSIFISIDETTDKEERFIANVIVGALNQSNSRPYVIHMEHLERTNAQTIAKTMNTALQILWPNGIKHDRVLLFVSDAAAYMKKAGKDLSILYTQMIHVTCLAHGLHRVVEEIRNTFLNADSLVNNVKKVFLKAPNRVHFLKQKYPNLPIPPKPIITRWGTWLNAIEHYTIHWTEIRDVVLNLEDESLAIFTAKELFENNGVVQELSEFFHLNGAIAKLETSQQLTTKETLKIWDDAVEGVLATDFVSIKRKMEDVASKNTGLQIFKLINSGQTEELKNFDQFSETQITPQQLIAYKYAPLVSVDVERSFSLYKRVLDDHRRNFKVENLKNHLIISFYKNFNQK